MRKHEMTLKYQKITEQGTNYGLDVKKMEQDILYGNQEAEQQLKDKLGSFMKDHFAKKKPKNKKKIILNLKVIKELELEMDYDKFSDGRSIKNY